VLAAGFYYKYLVLRNLEARFLKTWNLGGFLCAPQEPGATQRVDSENTTLKYMLADSRKQSANGLAAEGADDKGDTLSAGECLLDKCTWLGQSESILIFVADSYQRGPIY
jgi:hypothetical protein